MRRLLAILLSLLLLVSLSACGQKTPAGSEPIPTDKEDQGGKAPEITPTTSIPLPLTGDTYWVACEIAEDGRPWMSTSDNILTDLTLWADGTARIREIENGIWLINEGDEQNMTWKQEKDGTLNLYTVYSGDEPCWSGTVTEDGIALNHLERTFYFRQEPMPEGGALYSPAELQGVWLQIGSEVEGYVEESLPGCFYSLVFHNDWSGDQQTLLVSSERGDYSGYVASDTYYNREVTVLDDIIYSGCGNEEWSVRIGDLSPLNENGYPENPEIYVTLLDQNTLLQQQYFSFDGGPGVSYQTYKRFLPEVCWDLDAADLEGGDFELVSFTAADGTKQDAPDGVSDFYLHLDTDGAHFFSVTFDDGREFSSNGKWIFGEGGTLLLFNPDSDGEWLYHEDIECDWFAGAAQSFNKIPEIYLWYEGGIMRLEHVDGSGGENYGGGYVDTMDDLEGNAFAAPGNAVLVFYGDEYLDMDWYRQNKDLPFYELTAGPDARQVLISCVLDNTDVWIENNGLVVAQLGPLMAGESVIVQLSYPESGGSHLCFEFGGNEYYIELDRSSLPLDTWDYINVA